MRYLQVEFPLLCERRRDSDSQLRRQKRIPHRHLSLVTFGPLPGPLQVLLVKPAVTASGGQGEAYDIRRRKYSGQK